MTPSLHILSKSSFTNNAIRCYTICAADTVTKSTIKREINMSLVGKQIRIQLVQLNWTCQQCTDKLWLARHCYQPDSRWSISVLKA